METDSGNYVLITYEARPFKKPPLKGWKYINPADSLTNPKEQLDYCRTKGHLLNDTTYLFPYYQKAGFVEADEYFEFYEYTRDSIILHALGEKYIKIAPDGQETIDWKEAKKNPNFHRKPEALNIMSSLLHNDANRIESQRVVDKREIDYMSSPKYYSTQMLSNCHDQSLRNDYSGQSRDDYKEIRAQRLPFLCSTRPYPDTFLWAGLQQMDFDSSMAVALANHGFALKSDIRWPLLDKHRACAYTHWYSSQLRLDLKGSSNEIQFFFDVDSSTMFPTIEKYFDPFELQDFQITYDDYQEFLTYCHDSMVAKTSRSYLDRWRESGSFDKCYTLSHDSMLTIKGRCLRYYWKWVDQPKAIRENVHRSWQFVQRQEFIYSEEEYVWNGSLWDDFLQKPIPKTLRHQTIDSLSFRQATAYWHWRLHVKMKNKKKTLADYLTPTYAEWKKIQSGEPVSGRTIKMPYPRPKFTYRVYVHL